MITIKVKTKKVKLKFDDYKSQKLKIVKLNFMGWHKIPIPNPKPKFLLTSINVNLNYQSIYI